MYDRASRWYRFVEEPFERRAGAVGLDLLRAGQGERVLELGCGAGGALVALARAVGPEGRVAGLDLAPGMIRRAASRLRGAGLADRAHLRVGDAMSIPFEDSSFDAVFAAFTLELFDTPEIPLVLAECRRVLRSGGRIAVVSLARSDPVGWATRFYERLHDRFPITLDCRPIHPRLALEAAGFEGPRSAAVPLWGLRAEAVVAVRPAAARPPADATLATALSQGRGRTSGRAGSPRTPPSPAPSGPTAP
jgi:demethylmenaquinone methyltransferase/2-methoxy-6-polyprenyl-1,4-benzoquinol methylase